MAGNPFDFSDITQGRPTGFGPGPITAGHPPVRWLVAGIVVAAVAVVTAAVFGRSVPVAFAAWALAGPVAIGLLAVFAVRDTRERSRPLYTSPSWTPTLYWSVIVVAAVGIALSAWRIADWAGRL